MNMNIAMDTVKTFGKKYCKDVAYCAVFTLGVDAVVHATKTCCKKAKGHLADRPKKMKKVKNPEEIMEKFEGK